MKSAGPVGVRIVEVVVMVMVMVALLFSDTCRPHLVRRQRWQLASCLALSQLSATGCIFLAPDSIFLVLQAFLPS